MHHGNALVGVSRTQDWTAVCLSTLIHMVIGSVTIIVSRHEKFSPAIRTALDTKPIISTSFRKAHELVMMDEPIIGKATRLQASRQAGRQASSSAEHQPQEPVDPFTWRRAS